MPENNHSFYGEEVSEVIHQTPNKMIQWGTSVVLFIALIIVAVCWFVKYSDIVYTEAIIRSSNTPKSIIAQTDGKLIRFWGYENKPVNKGDVIGYIESNADYKEIQSLYNDLKKIRTNIQNNNVWEDSILIIKNYSNLGDIHSSYQAYISSLIQLKPFLSGTYIQKKVLITKEIEDLKKLKNSLLAQQTVYEKDFQIALDNFQISEKLHKENVLPLLEYKQEKSKLLNKQLPLENIQSLLINNNTSEIVKKQELIQLEQLLIAQKANFLQSSNALANNIIAWKQKYELLAPIKGRLVLPTVIQENQDLLKGQQILFVVPANNHYYIEMKVKQSKLGKITIGQSVQISLDGYPKEEFGKLAGKTNFIADIPNQNGEYIATANIDGLVTNYGYKLNLKNGMRCNGEIITQKSRLLFKLFLSVKKLLTPSSYIKQ